MISFINFEGLNEEETLKEIRRIKRTINFIEKHPGEYWGDKIVNPSEDVILYWNRRFLKEGIAHLENDLHIPYIRTKKEQKEKEFVDRLNHLKKFCFYYYNSSYKVQIPGIILVFEGNNYHLEFEEYNDMPIDDYGLYFDIDKYYSGHKKTRNAFLKQLDDLNFESWKREDYIEETVLKEKYEICLEYDDGGELDEFYGNVINDNFLRLKEYIEDLVSDYLKDHKGDELYD